jgi:nucleoside-diphosphate-sugar epimerase
MPSTIFVTGGAGFIGKRLVHRSLTRRERVTVVDKAFRPKDFPSDSHLNYRRADVYRIEALIPPDEQSHLKIVHLAAETSVSRSILRPLANLRNNVGVTCALLEFARKADTDVFLFASSAAVYGNERGVCRESNPPDPRSPYAASKLAGEYYCRMYAKTYGLPTVILRLFNVYGPGQSQRSSGVVSDFLRTVSQQRSPIIYGDGRQIRDFIFVDDVIEAILRVLNQKLAPGTVLNIGTGRGTTVRVLAEKVLRLLHREDLRPVYLPTRAGEVRHSQADITLARKRIGFRPEYDIDRGLKMTYRWLKSVMHYPSQKKDCGPP